MKQYRKRPVVIEAVQYDGTNGLEIQAWSGNAVDDTRSGHLEIRTLEGLMIGQVGDWIIRGVKHEFYPCKDEIFRATYEPVEEGR